MVIWIGSSCAPKVESRLSRCRCDHLPIGSRSPNPSSARAARQFVGQSNGHFQRVGSVVVIADRKLAQLLDEQRRARRMWFESQPRRARYGPSRRIRTCLFTRFSMLQGERPTVPAARNAATN